MPTTYAPPDFDHAAPSDVTLDGGMMLWAGLSYGTASLVQYLVLTDVIHLRHPAMGGMAWMVAAAVFIVAGVVLKIGSKRSHLGHPAVKRFRSIWFSLILGALVVTTSLAVILVKVHLGATAAFVTAPVMTSVYGVGWRIAGVMSGNRLFNILALGSFAAAIGLAMLAGAPEQLLGYAGTLVCFAVLPGAVLMTRQV